MFPSSNRKRLVAAVLGVVLALGATTPWWNRRVAAGSGALDGDAFRAAATRLAQHVGGLYDSHPDAEVGRVLAPQQDALDTYGARVDTNAYGMREREYALPKPPDTLRIVLLGDSYVFGWAVASEERFGAFLERFLAERLPPGSPRVECLHLGVASWNLKAECAFLSRQLDRLQPDLVFHVTVSNDIEDVTGVRGFGVQASFPSAHRERADGLIWQDHPSRGFGMSVSNVLPFGLDGESGQRFDEARDLVQRLVDDLARLPHPARYVLVGYWGMTQPVLHERLGASLPPERRFYFPESFWADRENVLSETDYHWSPLGHERVARVLYGLILERGLLPELDLAPWPEALAEARELGAEGLADAEAGLPATVRRGFELIDSAVDFRTLDLRHAVQVYGGIDAEGLVSPYAALTLRAPGARVLELSGRALPDRVLAGAEVRVLLDGIEVARFALEPDAPISVRAEVPAELAGRDFLALQLVTSGFVYRGADLRKCVGWQLHRAQLGG